MLNTPDYDSFILSIVNKTSGLSNPYKNADPNFTMEYRFLPDHFIASEGHHLSYLVSHLDGISYEVVKSIIDKSKYPDMSGTAYWILDDDPGWTSPEFIATRDKLDELGFNFFWNNDDTWITSYPEKVMGYTSWGTHAEDYNCNFNDSAWVKDSLHFDLANGSVFNTYESFNGNSLTTLNWRYVQSDTTCSGHTQGLATQFTEIGGTGTMGHAWEPGGVASVVTNSIFFPAYQMGYNLVDAFYQGLPALAWQNFLVGDPLVRIYDCENTVISTNTTIGSGDYDCNVIVPQNVTLTIASGSTINFSRNAYLKVYGTLEVSGSDTLNFNSYSRLIVDSIGSFSAGLNSHFIFNDNSKFEMKHDFEINSNYNFIFSDQSEFQMYGSLTLDPGMTMNINDKSRINVQGSFNSVGEVGNEIHLFLSSTGTFIILDGTILQIENTIIYNGGIRYQLTSDQIEPEYLSITNTIFNTPTTAILVNTLGASFPTTPTISNCIFSNCITTAISISNVLEIDLESNTIDLNEGSVGINLTNNGEVNISDCEITGGDIGIHTTILGLPDPHLPEIIQNLYCDLSITQCTFASQNTSIELSGQSFPFDSIYINANHFENCVNGIIINSFAGPDNFVPVISNNVMSGNPHGGSEIGITLSNGDEVLVSDNSITNFSTGIYLSSVHYPVILKNTISAEELNQPKSGLVSISSNGEIRKNIIQHHLNGIEFGSSSPYVAENNITDNVYYGLYISIGSFPDLSTTIMGGSLYPLTGYNVIRENGECENSNSEIYYFQAGANLHYGCNTIADDRENSGRCDYTLLMDGIYLPKLRAEENYWGDHPVYGHDPSQRFGAHISVLYNPFREEPCTFSPGEDLLVLTTTQGNVIDTVYSSGEAPTELTDIESRYKAVNEYFYNHQYQSAVQELNGIIQYYGDSTSSLPAYEKLYTIANLTNSGVGSFNQLKEFYLQKAENQTDSIMIISLKHLADLCLVSATEYLGAINHFDQEVQQNPNTDIALYRQIDALTTALLLPPDSSLNKGVLGKYCVNNLSDYTDKISQLLRTRGRSGIESKKDLLPTEYTLYQNYPNPFNPTTTIKYDLPNTSDVSLIIYDILGRKVKELVHSKQEAGRYEINFNASNLASGVYVYQLISEKYLSAKKMILLK